MIKVKNCPLVKPQLTRKGDNVKCLGHYFPANNVGGSYKFI